MTSQDFEVLVKSVKSSSADMFHVMHRCNSMQHLAD